MAMSLIILPADILQHHIIPSSGACGIVVCSLVSLRFRNICKNIYRTFERKNMPKKSQSELLTSLFADGFAHLLLWFRSSLHYPILRRRCRLLSSLKVVKICKSIDLQSNLAISARGKAHQSQLNKMINYVLFLYCIGGHLEILRLALQAGYMWHRKNWRNYRICSEAAAGGHLELLQWLRKNGCAWNHETCTNAAAGDYLEVLQWAVANQCPFLDHSSTVSRACQYEAKQKEKGVLKWLLQRGETRWDVCWYASVTANRELLRWASSNRLCTCTSSQQSAERNIHTF